MEKEKKSSVWEKKFPLLLGGGQRKYICFTRLCHKKINTADGIQKGCLNLILTVFNERQQPYTWLFAPTV